MKKIVLIAIVLLLLLSCQPQRSVSYNKEYTYWSEVFEDYWSNMLMRYSFWHLDYDKGRGWYDVRDEYAPLFKEIDELGTISELSGEDTCQVMRYFMRIIWNLSDGHYAFRLQSGNFSGVTNKGLINIYKDLGLDADKAVDMLIDGTMEELMENVDISHESLSSILGNMGISVPSSYAAKTEEGSLGIFSDCRYYFNASSVSSSFFAGVTEDGIMYIMFSAFDIARAQAAAPELADEIDAVVDYFRDAAESGELNGLIIDLRGNPGGSNSDFRDLWSCLTPVDVAFGTLRHSSGVNPGQLGPGSDILVRGSETAFDAPIAVITNSGTASCGEITTLFLRYLGYHEGKTVRHFGGRSVGAMSSNFSGNPVSGGFSAGPVSVTMQDTVCTYYEGEYEGIGITPHEEIPFDKDAFLSGRDTRLDRAFEWVREEAF